MIDLSHLSPAKRELFERVAGSRRAALSHSGMIPTRTGGKARAALSFAQERMWFVDRLNPGTSAYNTFGKIRIAGALRLDVLERAVNEIVRRHEVLRTTYEDGQSGPVQVIHEARWRELPVMDLSGLAEAEQSVEARRLIGEEGRRPFDLGRGPVLRVGVLRLGDEDHVILHTLHHIGSDGWSMDVINREMAHLYGAYEKGQGSPLAELAIQYADYAEWQRQWMSGEVLAKQLAYWKGQLAGVSSLQLPTDHPRSVLQSFGGGVRAMRMGKEVTAGLKALGQREGVTLFMVLAAGLQALFSRYSGQKDVAIGMPIANRNRRELEELVGCLVNTLVLRTDLSGDPTVRGLLERVKEVTLGAYGHQDLPFEKLVTELQPERDPGRNPLFQVILTLENASREVRGFARKELGWIGRGGAATTRFDLEVHFRESGPELAGQVIYNTSLFGSATVERMVRHLERVFEFFVAAPGRRLSELPLLTDAERQQLVEWNRATREYPPDRCVHELFEEQVERSPNAVAVVCEGERLNYRQLNDRANELAYRLRELGVNRDVLVGVCMKRSIEMVIALLGILKAGGAYVPLDSGYPRERLAFVFADAQLKIVATGKNVSWSVDGPTLVTVDGNSPVQPGRRNNPRWHSDPQQLMYLIYTSGSTGMPKGVQISHYNVRRLFQATEESFQFDAADVWTLFHSYAFDFSVWELWGALLYGGRLIVVPYHVSRSPDEFLELLSREKVTVLNQTPSAFSGLQEAQRQAGRELALRLVIFGGEALNVEDLRPWYDRHNDTRPQLINMYGITETTVHVTSRELRKSDVGGGSLIGKALPDLSLYIVDETWQLAPVGVAGEIRVGGAGLARGYRLRPELTAERFVPDPFGPGVGARLYRSGDAGRYLANGDIEYLGRIDHQVKIRGFRIEPGEIESALRRCAGVSEAIVLAREDAPGGKQLVAYVVSAFRSEEKNWAQQLKRYLPEYMVPSAFVTLAKLPLTPNGKIDRQALPAPELRAERPLVPPRTPVEEVLAGMFCEVLGLKQVGVHESFFDLGGHSLLATQVQSRVREFFPVEFPLRTVFDRPTVEQLSQWIEAAGDAAGIDARKIAAVILQVNDVPEEDLEMAIIEAASPKAIQA